MAISKNLLKLLPRPGETLNVRGIQTSVRTAAELLPQPERGDREPLVTFEEALRIHALSETDLPVHYRRFVVRCYVDTACSVVLFMLFCFYLACGALFAASIAFFLLCISAAYAVRASFFAKCVRERRIGTLGEWCREPSQWLPTWKMP